MSKKINLSIPEPCHQSWNDMSPTGTGRYCGSCQKEVIDFTHMSESQLIAYFKQPKGATCGRFHTDQLGHDLTVPPKRIPWSKYFFQFSLPAFLMSCKPGSTPLHVETMGILLKEPTEKVEPLKDTLKWIETQSDYLTGDIQLLPLPVDTARRTLLGDTILMTSKNEQEDTMPIYKTLDEVVVQSSSPHVVGKMVRAGAVSIVRPDTVYKIIGKLIDTIRLRSFRIFPNPAYHGGAVNVDWNGCAEGAYQMQIVAMSGQVLLQKDLTITSKNSRFSLSLPEIAPGTYLVSFVSAQVKKPIMQKLIVK
ncbi:MAG: hypothetical protein JWP88_1764 [Flaviaesturariibacter sp.]|nr:hypothetical protein [Flaviaesturariibacter sp.]